MRTRRRRGGRRLAVLVALTGAIVTTGPGAVHPAAAVEPGEPYIQVAHAVRFRFQDRGQWVSCRDVEFPIVSSEVGKGERTALQDWRECGRSGLLMFYAVDDVSPPWLPAGPHPTRLKVTITARLVVDGVDCAVVRTAPIFLDTTDIATYPRLDPEVGFQFPKSFNLPTIGVSGCGVAAAVFGTEELTPQTLLW